MIKFIAHVMGVDNVSGYWYGFWSGFGGDIAIFGAVVGFYWRHRCAKCWRFAKHPVEGTKYKTCHKHLSGDHHANLYQKHSEKYPDQHGYLNAGQ